MSIDYTITAFRGISLPITTVNSQIMGKVLNVEVEEDSFGYHPGQFEGLISDQGVVILTVTNDGSDEDSYLFCTDSVQSSSYPHFESVPLLSPLEQHCSYDDLMALVNKLKSFGAQGFSEYGIYQGVSVY